jgi:UV DNA damage endonuclease
MRIGYACLALGVPGSELKGCTQKNADGQRLAQLIKGNLQALELMVDYNLVSGIRLYRISSDLIPFGSSPVNRLDWANLFQEDFARIGGKIRAGGMRVSMHPGQYTVLGAPDEGVAARAVEDLSYHARVLDALGTDASSKIILHLGGVYGDKAASLERFGARFRDLDGAIRARVALENDDRLYTAEDALNAGLRLGAPVVFDNLHHAVNPSGPMEEKFWIDACRETWKMADGLQKVHYSQQDPEKKPGSHSATIAAGRFLEYLDAVRRDDLDVMLEVKDKNLSAVKCTLCAAPQANPKALEAEWARYKYAVLERSQSIYLDIRGHFREGNVAPLPFYSDIERALMLPVEPGNAINAAGHVWGYFKDRASEAERRSFQAALERFQTGLGTLDAVKRKLYALAEGHNQPYLLESYYFWL